MYVLTPACNRKETCYDIKTGLNAQLLREQCTAVLRSWRALQSFYPHRLSLMVVTMERLFEELLKTRRRVLCVEPEELAG
jgi:hypothetical protein